MCEMCINITGEICDFWNVYNIIQEPVPLSPQPHRYSNTNVLKIFTTLLNFMREVCNIVNILKVQHLL